MSSFWRLKLESIPHGSFYLTTNLPLQQSKISLLPSAIHLLNCSIPGTCIFVAEVLSCTSVGNNVINESTMLGTLFFVHLTSISWVPALFQRCSKYERPVVTRTTKSLLNGSHVIIKGLFAKCIPVQAHGDCWQRAGESFSTEEWQ